jgi:hypothetical protein
MDQLIQKELEYIIPVKDYVLHQNFQNFWVFTSQIFW